MLLRIADGRHVSGGRRPPTPFPRRGLLTISAHNAREIARANRLGADLLFLSPVFPTQSHRHAAPLGLMRFAALVRNSAAPVIALGGMEAKRYRRMAPLGAHGWAAVDALSLPGKAGIRI